MRGLPPVPTGVFRLTQSFDTNGYSLSTSFWLLDVTAGIATTEQLDELLTGWFNFCLPSLLELQHNGTIPITCRLAGNGLSTVRGAPPAAGAWAGGEPNNCAAGIRWTFQGVGRRSWTMSYVPGLPDVFVADGARLTELGYGNISASATDLLNQLNALTASGVPAIVAGTLQRTHNGAPLPSSRFAPYDSGIPIPKVVTIRRRIPARSPLSPSP